MKTIIQHDSSSCGPVAISNSMRLLGLRPPSIKKLRKMCKTDSNGQGTFIIDVIRTCRKLGLEMVQVNKRVHGEVYIMLIDVDCEMAHFVVYHKCKVYNNGYFGRYFYKSKRRIKVDPEYLWRIDKL